MQGQREQPGEGCSGIERTHFIQPPIAVPRKMTCWPWLSTILSPDVLKIPVAILETASFRVVRVVRV